MVSSASAQIESSVFAFFLFHQRLILTSFPISAGGNNIKTTVNGKVVPNYATVEAILIGVVAAFTLVITLFGPEKHGFQFEKHRAAFEEGGGDDDAIIGDDIDQADSHDGETDSQENEKGRAAMVENSEKV